MEIKMDKNFGALVCSKCGEFTICYKEDAGEDFIGVNCDCDAEKKFIPGNEMKNPDFFIRTITDELENANYHSFVDLPDGLYYDITKSINANEWQKLAIAKAIYAEFYNTM
jgi:hypothetical protein